MTSNSWMWIASGRSFFKNKRYPFDFTYQNKVTLEVITVQVSESACGLMPNECRSINDLLAIDGVKLYIQLK